MNERTFVLKGTICYSNSLTELSITENGYLVCEDGRCAGVFDELPEKFAGISCTDFGDELIIPGLTDLHLHAPQYTFRASGMDLELLDWLNTYTFPQEARYEDTEFAKEAYSVFAEDMKKSPNTRACIFGTLHVPATEILMEQLDKTGIKAMVGKVNMDRNGSPQLQEESAQASADATVQWIKDTLDKFENVKPILTPRFTPSCSDELMEKLSEIQKRYHLPMQSHLSENFGEIAWVKELCPNTHFYGEAYSQFDLFGGDCPTIMAHCVHSSNEEIALMKKQGVYIAHCPQSNTNLSSGISPTRRYLDEGLHIGLGSDIAVIGKVDQSFKSVLRRELQWSWNSAVIKHNRIKFIPLLKASNLSKEGTASFCSHIKGFFNSERLHGRINQPPVQLGNLNSISHGTQNRNGSSTCNITAKYVAGRKIL